MRAEVLKKKCLTVAAAVLTLLLWQPAAAVMLNDTQLLPKDKNSWRLIVDIGDPGACENECRKDALCDNWTWVRPATLPDLKRPGLKASCVLLKGDLLPPKRNPCCISGGVDVVTGGDDPYGLPAPPSPAPSPLAVPSILGDTNFVGGDIGLVANAKHPEVCVDACAANPACKSWTWVRAGRGLLGTGEFCALKGQVLEPVKDTCCVSGYAGGSAPATGSAGSGVPPPPPPRPSLSPAVRLENMNIIGGDLKGVPNAADPQVCVESCRKDPACGYWTWVKPGALPLIPRPNLGGFCALKTDVPALAYDACCESGGIDAGFFDLPSTPAKQFSPLGGTNLFGEDLTAVWGVGDPKICERVCRNVRDCAGWTWVKRGKLPEVNRPGLAGFCSLKKKIERQVASDCCDSGASTGFLSSTPPSGTGGGTVAGVITDVAVVPEDVMVDVMRRGVDTLTFTDNAGNKTTASLRRGSPAGAVEPVDIAQGAGVTRQEGNLVCSTEKRKLDLERSEMQILSPNWAELWPGAIYSGEAVLSGSYAPVTKVRWPIRIYTTAMNVPRSYIVSPVPGRQTCRAQLQAW